MLFDTDMIIWFERGNRKALKIIEASENRYVSIVTKMELLQGARDKKHLLNLETYLSDFNFLVLPLSEDIGHRALIYIEEYALSHGLRCNDAIIAATAVENNLHLVSSNTKHYKSIKDLKYHPFIT